MIHPFLHLILSVKLTRLFLSDPERPQLVQLGPTLRIGILSLVAGLLWVVGGFAWPQVARAVDLTPPSTFLEIKTGSYNVSDGSRQNFALVEIDAWEVVSTADVADPDTGLLKIFLRGRTGLSTNTNVAPPGQFGFFQAKLNTNTGELEEIVAGPFEGFELFPHADGSEYVGDQISNPNPPVGFLDGDGILNLPVTFTDFNDPPNPIGGFQTRVARLDLAANIGEAIGDLGSRNPIEIYTSTFNGFVYQQELSSGFDTSIRGVDLNDPDRNPDGSRLSLDLIKVGDTIFEVDSGLDDMVAQLFGVVDNKNGKDVVVFAENSSNQLCVGVIDVQIALANGPPSPLPVTCVPDLLPPDDMAIFNGLASPSGFEGSTDCERNRCLMHLTTFNVPRVREETDYAVINLQFDPATGQLTGSTAALVRPTGSDQTIVQDENLPSPPRIGGGVGFFMGQKRNGALLDPAAVYAMDTSTGETVQSIEANQPVPGNPDVACSSFGGIDPFRAVEISFGGHVFMMGCWNPIRNGQVEVGKHTVFVAISAPPDVEVPNVVEKSELEAIDAILLAGLTEGTITREGSFTVPEGDVISQTPEAGDIVPEGTHVDLVISLGPIIDFVLVPPVVDLTFNEAEDVLLASGLTLGIITEQFSDTVPKGVVISQMPEVGDTVLRGSSVDLVTSLGPGVIVPDVRGLEEVEATTTLTDLGLEVFVMPIESDTVPAGEVIAQNLEPGSEVSLGQAILLQVSTGPLLFTVPDVVGLLQESAIDELLRRGFGHLLVLLPSDTVPQGIVSGQFPVGGAQVPFATVVNIVVSTGPEIRIPGDIDGDGDVDLTDKRAMQGRLNTMATGLSDPYDLNGDGRITGRDLALLIQSCTLRACKEK